LPKESGEGRPKLSKDSEKRKQKIFSPQTGAKLMLWSSSAQDQISNIINPIILEYFNKKNIRSLSNTENETLENIKTNILFDTKPFNKINKDIMLSSNMSNNNSISKDFYIWLSHLKSELNRELTVEEIKQAKASFYTMVYNN
jgi:hypothetical protein